jgi:hypothetical protein
MQMNGLMLAACWHLRPTDANGKVRINYGKESLFFLGFTIINRAARICSEEKWWAQQDSNLQPDGYEPSALTN